MRLTFTFSFVNLVMQNQFNGMITYEEIPQGTRDSADQDCSNPVVLICFYTNIDRSNLRVLYE